MKNKKYTLRTNGRYVAFYVNGKWKPLVTNLSDFQSLLRQVDSVDDLLFSYRTEP